jgi:calcineurin-like phosphoesterase family protein
MAVWFTSDLHLGHANLLERSARGTAFREVARTLAAHQNERRRS